jgi:CheY-like chemotaxis protein
MPPPAAPHVLVVDHEPAILALLAGGLTRAGYSVTTARDLPRGAAMLADPGRGFAAAVLPDRAAGPSVRDFLADRPNRAGLPVVVTAASVDPATAAAVAADPLAVLLAKPFTTGELVGAVAELLSGGGPAPRGPCGPGPRA